MEAAEPTSPISPAVAAANPSGSIASTARPASSRTAPLTHWAAYVLYPSSCAIAITSAMVATAASASPRWASSAAASAR